ncbi:probable ureide permease A3, partial [Neltuma alba]|uniref:probable ureide permease A3 n=1 Tax=Neltuma alba TaxID=207710 RepID=UPI0010A42F8F
MYLVESRDGAILCMLLPLFFLGTRPTTITLLERRGRLPQHTYLDYTITNILAAVLIALTFGEIGKSTPDKPNFIDQLYQDNWLSVLFAMVSGVVLSIGNLSTQYALALVGLSVAEVVSASITVVIGTNVNYFLDDGINRAQILFPGVGCFFIAVCLGLAVHSSNISDDEAKLNNLSDEGKDGAILINISSGKEISGVKSKDIESGGAGSVDTAKAGRAAFLVELEKQRAIKAGFWEEYFRWIGHNDLSYDDPSSFYRDGLRVKVALPCCVLSFFNGHAELACQYCGGFGQLQGHCSKQ